MYSFSSAMVDPARRHDFLFLFEAVDSNPNGDPDAGNAPRIDPETSQGIITDVAIKRKIRNYVVAYEETLAPGDPRKERLKIFVEEGCALNAQVKRAFTALGLTNAKKVKAVNHEARAWMCDNFFDVRMFGAVMSTGDYNAGQVKGPFQIAFGRSVDPIFQQDISITRVAVTKEEELAKLQNNDEKGGKDQAMGRKAIVPYGLYQVRGSYSPMLGYRKDENDLKATGVTAEDLELFWTAVLNMWDFDMSAARGNINLRGLYVFSHTNPLGDAHRDSLLSRVKVSSLNQEAPRTFAEYKVELDPSGLPSGVECQEIIP